MEHVVRGEAGGRMIDLSDLVDAALLGGREVMRVYAGGFETRRKADDTPVTEADHASERVVVAALARIAPGVPVVAEEAASEGRVPDHAERFILLDPLDGTREFCQRSGEFTVNIGLVENGVPVAGVILAPALGLLYAGRLGKGAFRAAVDADGVAGAPEPIATRRAPSALVVAASRSHGVEAASAFAARLPVERFVQRGSSLKYGLVAEGAADLYPRFGRTMEWDTAAGEAILVAAGGGVLRLDGSPLGYGKRGRADAIDFANPDFLAYGDPALVARLFEAG